MYLLVPAVALAQPKVEVVDSAAAALSELLAREPRVVAFGEYHSTEATKAIPSALHHFIEELLPVVGPRASDLVLETWVAAGGCGKQEKQVVSDVQTTTQRPEETEDELVVLVKRAKAAGIAPHILELSCKEYASLEGKDGIDYVRLLSLINDKLAAQLVALSKRPPPKLILSYGGALHNDLYPRKELARYTFGRKLDKRTRGRYLEVDLYVPELVAKDRDIPKEPWYAAWQAAKRPGKAALVERGPGSYIILFPETPPAR